MNGLEIKIEKCKNLMNILLNIKDINNIPCSRYYIVLRIYQNLKKEHNEQLNELAKIKRENQPLVESSKKCYFDLPELKITSTTYDKAKKRLENQIDNRFKNRASL